MRQDTSETIKNRSNTKNCFSLTNVFTTPRNIYTERYKNDKEHFECAQDHEGTI
jgi:hypothetical protein